MKKTLIALAVLAASGAAMAQSSVTLYGVADVWVGSTKTGDQRQTVINSAGVNGSRFGLKGTEDLGNGLKAIFQLESGFNLDSGSLAQGGTMFGRQAYVGLDGGFGTLTLGRQYSSYDDFRGGVNHTGDAATFNATGDVFSNGIADYTSRFNNSVKFKTANYSGFSANVFYALGENKNAADNAFGDATDGAGLNVQYANGPVVVGYAYQQEKGKKNAFLANQDKTKYNLVGASYDFGAVKLVGSYNQAKNDSTRDKEYQVGVMVPFGAAAISAGYAHSKSDTGNYSGTGKGFAVLATYDMSKRTRLYAGATDTKVQSLTGVQTGYAAEVKKTAYGLGVRHSF